VRLLFSIIFAAVAAVAFALLVRFDTGNVVLFYPPYRVDLSLNLFALLAVASFIILYALIRLVRNTAEMPRRVAEYRQRQQEKRAYRALRQSLIAYFEGRFGQAEKQANEAQDVPEVAGLAALVGARAAHRMTEYARRDNWLKRADGSDGLRAARLMTEADCLVDARDSVRALQVVSQLHAAGARHIQSLRLALKANQYAEHWEEVLRLLRLLNKRDALHPAAAREIKVVAYRALLSARQGDGYALIAFWQGVASADRRVAEIALAAAQAFNHSGLGYQARSVLEAALATNWDVRLIDEFARCVEQSSTAQIERAERWLVSHARDTHLEYALGVLCARAGLWGKSQSYLEAALADDRDDELAPRIHLALAQLFEHLGQSDAAARHFRHAALAGSSDSLLGSPVLVTQ
jgi:HemY protein